MAVQTQHASSYFFSNGQEDNNCSSLQPQQPKEVSSVDFIQFSSPAAAPMNPPPPKPPQAIDLSELLQNHNPLKSNVVPSTTGFRSSHDHRSHNQEQLLSTFSMLSGDLAGEYKRQRYELDMFLQTQSEELQRNLASNRERQYVELLYAAEELARRRVREKEAELEKATRRHAELKARAAQLAEGARTWQLRAATREAEVSSLQAHIQKVLASQPTAAKQSMIGGDGEEAEDAESVFVDPERVGMNGPSCRICWRKPATVMALPCRHLVLCKGCDGGGAVRVCPICFAVKSSGVEVLFC
ncbi:SBP (S-ribonuclease binding protein) family protein [Raphanus sativus]|uniref:BOI-related E3 ubiquitin-protein ligase 1 n=1 Tax=Raphanus sativus TaxID=3726 RepID=A0A6J0M962_RAPSA|nr:BOI-related E3 ubiquitin-protein ligase 1 [Raphanus sativus]KAJ4912528.1 SBP (S-ribonuclease binding protein) family protein [Raphanus sativus]